MAYISEGVSIGDAHSYVGQLMPGLLAQRIAQRIAKQAAPAYAHPDSSPGGPVVMMPSVSVFPILAPTPPLGVKKIIKKAIRPVTVMTVPVPQARPQGVFPSRFPLRGRRVGWSRTGQTFRGLGDDSMFGQGGEYPVIHGGAPHSLFGTKTSEVF